MADDRAVEIAAISEGRAGEIAREIARFLARIYGEDVTLDHLFAVAIVIVLLTDALDKPRALVPALIDTAMTLAGEGIDGAVMKVEIGSQRRPSRPAGTFTVPPDGKVH